MVLFNRILNFLILILALISVVFTVLLYQRRIELRDRGDKLAKTVNDVVKALDANSGTSYATKITTDSVPGPDGGDLFGGTLGSAYFHDIRDPETKSYEKFDTVLETFKTQATTIRDQRDELAKAVSEHAKIFDQEGTDVAAYQSVETYKDSVNAVFERLQGVRDRDDEIFSKIEETAKKIGIEMTKGQLMDVATYQEPLNNLGATVTEIKDRSENYADTIEEAIQKIDAHDFEVNVEGIRDKDAYVNELAAIRNDFANINQKLKDYEEYKIEFLETKDTLERTVGALESASENLAALESKLANVENDYVGLRKKYNRLVGETATTQTAQLKKIEGRVINVNYDWNYIIIDLGTKDNLPDSLEMIVAREKEYICKVLVTRVYENYSVAEILPKIQKGNVIEGDRVIF